MPRRAKSYFLIYVDWVIECVPFHHYFFNSYSIIVDLLFSLLIDRQIIPTLGPSCSSCKFNYELFVQLKKV